MRLNKYASYFIGVSGVIILIIMTLLKGYTVFIYDWPQEFREMATVKLANDFSKGINPYSIDLLQADDLPVINNMYGFLVPLVMSLFISVLREISCISALQICELVTLGVEVIGLVFAYKEVFIKTGRQDIAIWSAISIFACYWRYSPVGGAFPDQFGLTLSLIIVYYITKCEEERKCNPVLCAIFVIILFYIKQYFVFIALSIFIYFCINYSLKRAISFVVSGALLGAISIIVVNYIFPLYFTETIPLAQGQTSTGNWQYSLMQIIKLLGKSFAINTIFFIVAIVCAFYYIKKRQEKIKVISIELLQVFCVVPFVFYIAQNTGTIYTYYLQLWVPYIVICSMVGIDSVLKLIKKPNIKLFLAIPLCISFVISCKWNMKWIRQPLLNKKQIADWNKAYQILNDYASNGEILVSPHLSNYCLDNEIYTAEYGQAEFNTNYNLENWENNYIWRNIFPYGKDILVGNLMYREKIHNKIIAAEYECIALTSSGNYEIPVDNISELTEGKYYLIDKLILDMGNQEWETYFYVKNK